MSNSDKNDQRDGADERASGDSVNGGGSYAANRTTKPSSSLPSARRDTPKLDRDWWRAQGIEACMDRMELMAEQAAARSSRGESSRADLAADLLNHAHAYVPNEEGLLLAPDSWKAIKGLMEAAAAFLRADAKTATRSATRDTLGIEHVIAIVTRLIEDVAEDPTRLARAQELARRDILPLLATRPERGET